MFTLNDDKSIYATRGDAIFLSVGASDKGIPHEFQQGDILRMTVMEKKRADQVVLQKDFLITEATQAVPVVLTSEEMKIGDSISKPKDYWYELELNPGDLSQTIVGYDEDGPKVLRLFPEGEAVSV